MFIYSLTSSVNLKSDAYYNRIRPHTIIYDRIRQSYSSVYGLQTVIFKSLRIFIRSPYTVSISHRFTPYTVPVYGSCVRPPYIFVFHRKRSFTTVHVRPGYSKIRSHHFSFKEVPKNFSHNLNVFLFTNIITVFPKLKYLNYHSRTCMCTRKRSKNNHQRYKQHIYFENE